ncbi:Inner membrane transport protein YajR [Marinomonas spartinae]|uniref:Inner membrane transport protein YajR n=1 Tax=Marinomonas spartinae TaxID=1792290 RepID=A0A1A8TSC0_9GAMM|nr:MFS transporter [Marinomonas spartinae]SBS30757.1 Inner membrane transport protein YajR [Marinomonas spartinae]SBS37127.1 Inner membrane transport protein YajR [Marinomonas spartinae]
MDALERRSVLALALVYLFRMLGLFLIMPVISVAADGLQGADAALIGTAIGIYGFTQAILQIPMGMWSDRIGRKRVIVIGLLLFALGSLICANATSIHVLIVGRALQGAGAIASTLMALLSDVTREKNRTKSMAMVGVSIGASFMISLVLGPWVFDLVGLSGLFYLSFGFSFLGIALILFVVPNVVQHTFKRDTTPSLVALGRVIKDSKLRFLNISVLLLHASLTALFITVPHLLIQRFGLPLADHSWLYLGVMGFAFVGMVPLVIIAEAKGKMKAVVFSVVLMLGLSAILLQWAPHLWVFGLLLWCYFVGFNTLEATLPSLISKQAPVGYRGTAMGVFSTHQFLGSFLGGIGGGWILQHYSNSTLFDVVGIVLMLWTAVCFMQPAPRQLSSMAFSLPDGDDGALDALADQLAKVEGVEDMQIFKDELTAYLKIDKKRLDKEALKRLAPQANI